MVTYRVQLLRRLDELGIAPTTFEHPPSAPSRRRTAPGHIAGGHCKNSLLKDRKGGLRLLVCLNRRRIDILDLEATGIAVADRRPRLAISGSVTLAASESADLTARHFAIPLQNDGSAVGGRNDKSNALLELAGGSVAYGRLRATERLQLDQYRPHHDGV